MTLAEHIFALLVTEEFKHNRPQGWDHALLELNASNDELAARALQAARDFTEADEALAEA